ncbi:MAG: ribonuclease E/G, partial [Paracoccaceae bacterium]
MAKKMLIDATHAEETRVVVVDGNKVEEFDFESENKRQLAGNIYLAKVTRVEPSLQAAFVEYGGNRHGFLAFSEIHPDYYQIPVADREALMAEEMAYADAQSDLENGDDEEKPRKRSSSRRTRAQSSRSKDAIQRQDVVASDATGMETIDLDDQSTESLFDEEGGEAFDVTNDEGEVDTDQPSTDIKSSEDALDDSIVEQEEVSSSSENNSETEADEIDDIHDNRRPSDAASKDDSIEDVAEIDDEFELRPIRKPRPRRYKIQEVIKMRQILLVQVVKEERGNKGAALTTYLSLAGRYCVLMPNTARGGGISRKITNAADRKKLKEIAGSIDVPKGAGLIIRTAGAKRTKTEVKRDYEYLLRLWEQIRELTLKSIAPAKIYEEGDLIKRSIRDLYNREIDEVLVEGERGYRIAKDFMKMIMPSHAKNVKNYQDSLPLFARYQVESYLGSMFNPVVQLKSGGYIVIGVTEALVAIDVNSGRATKEGSIEETALKTNLEAADEVARQLRLRDLAGLIVIDFIDMDERRNNASVEKRMKDRLKTDRARIQVGRISGFGLMEMSRQRLRPGMLEATTQGCPHCHGTGLIRSEDSLALAILRQIEEEGVRKRSREILLKCPVSVANFLMNQKREHIAQIEQRYGMAVRVEGIVTLISPEYEIEKFKFASRFVPEPKGNVVSGDAVLLEHSSVEEFEDEVTSLAPDEQEDNEDARPKKRRRRRRRRRGKGEGGEESLTDGFDASSEDADVTAEDGPEDGETGEKDALTDGQSDAAIAEVTPEGKVVEDHVADALSTEPEGEKTDDADTEPPKKKTTRKRKPRSAPKT